MRRLGARGWRLESAVVSVALLFSIFCFPLSAFGQTPWKLQATSNSWEWVSPTGTILTRYIGLDEAGDYANLEDDGSRCGAGTASCISQVESKYNSASTYSNFTTAWTYRLQNLGFNAAGLYSYTYEVYPPTSGNLPHAQIVGISGYAMSITRHATSHPIKDVYYEPYNGLRCKSALYLGSSASQIDPYDPNFQSEVTDQMDGSGYSSAIVTPSTIANIIFVLPDEPDYLFGIDYDSGVSGANQHGDLGYIIVASPPFQQAARTNEYPGDGSSNSYTYTDQTRWAKFTLRDFLLNEYAGTSGYSADPACTGAGAPYASCTGAYIGSGPAATALAALNTAWHTSYTTWNTSDANGIAGIQTGTYTSWGGVTACVGSGNPYAGCTGAGTGSGITQGTGFLDETGAGVISSGNCGSSGPLNGSAWANYPQIETDLHAFVAAFTVKYASQMQTAYEASCPSCTGGLPPLGIGLYIPPSYVSQAAAPYVDFMWIAPSVDDGGTSLTNIADNDGGKPIVVDDYEQAEPDSWVASHGTVGCEDPPFNCFSTQDARGANIQTFFPEAVLTKTSAGKYPVIGVSHWDAYDKYDDGNFGIVTPNDNLYDGSGDSTATPAAWMANHTYSRPAIAVDANGNNEDLVGVGTGTCVSGSVAPSWPAATSNSNPNALDVITADGTCHWLNTGTYTRTAETANYTDMIYPLVTTLKNLPATPSGGTVLAPLNLGVIVH